MMLHHATAPFYFRLNCIQTDHKAVMTKLEKSLHALHEVMLQQASVCPPFVLLYE